MNLRRAAASIGAVAILATGFGLSSSSSASAANMNPRDCNHQMVWGTPVATGQYIGVKAILTYTYAGYMCWWNGSGYTIHTEVENRMNNPFNDYSCLGIWYDGTWKAQGCVGGAGSPVGGGWYQTNSYTEWAFGFNAPFAVSDRSGTAATIVQPAGGFQQFPYVENWQDQ
jgi:hypothetical protein